MNKYMLSIAATAVLAAGALSAQEVRVYNWSDYIDEDLLTKIDSCNVRSPRGRSNRLILTSFRMPATCGMSFRPAPTSMTPATFMPSTTCGARPALV